MGTHSKNKPWLDFTKKWTGGNCEWSLEKKRIKLKVLINQIQKNDLRSQNRGTIAQFALMKLVSALLITKTAVTTVKMREFVSQTEQKWLLIKFGQKVTQGAIATGR